MPYATVNGESLYYEIQGRSGEPLVLTHGSWVDGSQWARAVPILARDFRVLTYDRRGHSRSEPKPGQGSIREDASDLATLIERLDLAPAHIVGNSFGASIVLRLAVSRPELFRAMILHEPPLLGLIAEDPESAAMLLDIQSRIGTVTELIRRGERRRAAEVFSELVGGWDQFTRDEQAIFVANADTFLDETREQEAFGIDLTVLSAFNRPTLLTVGDQSAPFFQRIVSKLITGLPGAKLQVLAGSGHLPHRNEPERYAKWVGEFLNASRGAGVGPTS